MCCGRGKNHRVCKGARPGASYRMWVRSVWEVVIKEWFWEINNTEDKWGKQEVHTNVPGRLWLILEAKRSPWQTLNKYMG